MARQRRAIPPPPSDPEGRFVELFQENRIALLAFALRRLVVAGDAADVVAETFLVAWRRIDEVPAGREARPWLFGVARRVLANHHRGEDRRSALTERLTAEIGRLDPPFQASSRVDEVQRAMARLRKDDQEVLRLVAWEELARDEIATVLGISRTAVRVRLHRARRRLAEQLQDLADDEGTPDSTPARLMTSSAQSDTSNRHSPSAPTPPWTTHVRMEEA
jgi:RNA polymerase sigma factor (sigma-70 family)